VGVSIGNMGSTDGFFNRLSFGWMNKVVKEGRKGEIVLENLPLPAEQGAEVAYSQFQTNWEAACKGGKPNFRSALFKTFGKDLMLAGRSSSSAGPSVLSWARSSSPAAYYCSCS
jgi:hypothetical protein